jgi:integrase
MVDVKRYSIEPPKQKNNQLSSSLDKDLQDKIVQVTKDFGSIKVCEIILNDRARLSKENALTACDYILVMKREINPSLLTIRNAIQILADLSKAVGAIDKKFENYTRENILTYLDKGIKPESVDPMHKWIGSYNQKLIILSRFLKWLYYPDVARPEDRNKLSAEDDVLFLKYVTNPRDRCYHTMSRDTSCRPHELLKLRIKDIVFKQKSGHNYAEVLVNGKTGSRSIPLIYSLPYVKDWILERHPGKNIPNSHVFVSFTRKSRGMKQLGINGAGRIYSYYQHKFFPKLLEDPKISSEDKKQISELLKKPWNPYIRRHTALTEKSTKLKAHVLNQHSGWSARSNMAQKYLHYFGNESSESLLEAYGVVSKEGEEFADALRPKQCPQCQEVNPIDAKVCANPKCRMILSYEGYQEVIESEKQKDKELEELKQRDRTNAEAIAKMQEQLIRLGEEVEKRLLPSSLVIKGKKGNRLLGFIEGREATEKSIEEHRKRKKEEGKLEEENNRASN